MMIDDMIAPLRVLFILEDASVLGIPLLVPWRNWFAKIVLDAKIGILNCLRSANRRLRSARGRFQSARGRFQSARVGSSPRIASQRELGLELALSVAKIGSLRVSLI